ncbi:hypothetical protein KGF57_001441 [Candida theae]|uniref:Uncharacterized protein n=1 Tax=Candida theae TaxID=1198502 RepID=A0AAD5BHH3_9ASCO|nr:uncharacterized protein KGF57_001441 [Candida theae]KAI5962707.1 hypothetical protein KGF57_001441 [Candida theae]
MPAVSNSLPTPAISSVSTFNSNKTTEHNYKLALKQFINKNFIGSFKLIHQVYYSAFNDYKQGTISEDLLIKIINLYLVVVGVCLKSKSLDNVQANAARNSFTSNEILNQIKSVWLEADIPYEIKYNIQLVYATNQDLILDKESYLHNLKKWYINIDTDDKFGGKLLDLVKFEILPQFELYDESERLIGDDESELQRLHDIKDGKEEFKNRLKQEQLQAEKAAKEAKVKVEADARKTAKESSLKYSSIKEIINNYSKEESRSAPSTSQGRSLSRQQQVQALKQRLSYILNITGSFLARNSVVLVVLIVLFLGSGRYLRNANIRDKIVETVKMAFKFTYV